MEFEVKMPNKPLSSDHFRQDNLGCELFLIEDKLFISGVDSVEEAKAKLDAHNPPARPEPTIEDKLNSVGLNLPDLKAALGL